MGVHNKEDSASIVNEVDVHFCCPWMKDDGRYGDRPSNSM